MPVLKTTESGTARTLGAVVCGYAGLRGGLTLGFSVRSAAPSSLPAASHEADHQRHPKDEDKRREQPQRPVKDATKEGCPEVG
jgi:hypothetical protein